MMWRLVVKVVKQFADFQICSKCERDSQILAPRLLHYKDADCKHLLALQRKFIPKL